MTSRCDNVPIEPCCNDMAELIMNSDIRKNLLFDPDGKEPYRFMIWWADCDCTPLLYCMSCGKRIKEVKK